LQKPDYRDPSVAPQQAARLEDALPCRVALYKDDPQNKAHPEISALLNKAASWLSDAGYQVEEVELPHLAEMAELWMAMLYVETSGPASEQMFELGGEDFKTSYINTLANLPKLTPVEFLQAWQRRLTIQRKWAAMLHTYPVAIMPTALQPVFPLNHDLEGAEAVGRIMKAYRPLPSIAGLALPAVSVPVGMAAGAPAGVQIVSAWYREERCLTAAAVLEKRIGAIIPIDPRGA
jgi:amidase